MHRLQGTGWLLVGVVAAIVVPATGLHRLVVRELGAVVEAPWGGILTGLGAFAVGAALYFRSHWAAAARGHRRACEATSDVAARLERLADDVERAGFLITDNLGLAARPPHADARSAMLLDGAGSHARKLGELAARARGLAARLRESGAPADPGRSPRDPGAREP